MSEPLTREQVEQIKDYQVNFTFDELARIVIGLNAQLAQAELTLKLERENTDAKVKQMGARIAQVTEDFEAYKREHARLWTIQEKYQACQDQLAQVTTERDEQKRFAQDYYDEASKGWSKFREAERQLAEAQAVFRVLPCHYVTAVDCNHQAMTDTVRCSCSVWTGTPQPSVGQAINEWVQHVLVEAQARIKELEAGK